MKILMASDMFTQVNGVSNSVLTLTEELRARGHEVKVLALSETTRSYREGDNYYIGSHYSYVYPEARMSMKRRVPLMNELLEWKPHIAHIQTEYSANYLALRIVRLCSIPVVMNFHTDYEMYLKRYFFSDKLLHFGMTKLYHYVYKHARRIIIPSPKVQDLLNSYGIDKKTVIIPTGIRLPETTDEPEKKAELLKKYGIENNGRVIVIVSRMSKEKNVEEIVNYMPDLLKKDSTVSLLVVGGGPYLDTLKKRVMNLGIGRRVRFTGMIDPKEINTYYRLGDLFVCASTFETQGMTYVEAMANGLPLVCRRDKCLIGVIADGENGYVYDTKEEYIGHILEILNDPEKKKRMSQASLERSKDYSREVFAKKVEKLYKEVIRECIEDRKRELG